MTHIQACCKLFMEGLREFTALMQTLISDRWQAQEHSLSTITKVECYLEII